ncbi:MAG: S1 RNA-binding domain-containing protein [Bacillota bacterium]|jgi:S1 RNA binding domain protein
MDLDLTVGRIVEGKITGITKFGAFVEIAKGVTGLVHISEVADSYVKDVSDYFKEQDIVKVKIVNISDGGKIALSIKQANKPAPPPPPPPQPVNETFFEDKLAKFLKDSNEKLLALKRHQEGRKGR